MKVVVFNEGTELRGNERQVAEVARGLAARGHEVVVSCRAGSPFHAALQAAGVRTTGLRPRGDADFVTGFRLFRFLKSERPDAVFVTTWSRAHWAVWAARRAGVPRVVQRLGLVRTVPAGLRGWKHRRTFRRVDAMVVNSPGVKRAWLASAPWFPAESVHVVANGMEIRLPERSTLREELGVGPETPLVVTVGKLERRKAVDVLLAAFARLGRPEARLVVAGEGGIRGELESRAASLGVAERVYWLGHRTDVPNVLRGADVFVQSSVNDSMSNALLEAMAAGLLVVSTDTAGTAETLGAREGRGPAGLVVPPGDAASLAEGLRRALEADAGGSGAAMRAEARWRIENWFTFGRMVDAVERVLAG